MTNENTDITSIIILLKAPFLHKITQKNVDKKDFGKGLQKCDRIYLMSESIHVKFIDITNEERTEYYGRKIFPTSQRRHHVQS